MFYQSRLLGFLRYGHRPIRLKNHVQVLEIADTVELVEVDVVDSQVLEAQFQVCLYSLPISGTGLGGDD